MLDTNMHVCVLRWCFVSPIAVFALARVVALLVFNFLSC